MPRTAEQIQKSLERNCEEARRAETTALSLMGIDDEMADRFREIAMIHRRWAGEDEDALDDLAIEEMNAADAAAFAAEGHPRTHVLAQNGQCWCGGTHFVREA